MKTLFLRSLYVILPLTGVAVIIACFWLAGFNFDQRGGFALSAFCFSIFAALMGFGWASEINSPKPPIVEQ